MIHIIGEIKVPRYSIQNEIDNTFIFSVYNQKPTDIFYSGKLEHITPMEDYFILKEINVNGGSIYRSYVVTPIEVLTYSVNSSNNISELRMICMPVDNGTGTPSTGTVIENTIGKSIPYGSALAVQILGPFFKMESNSIKHGNIPSKYLGIQYGGVHYKFSKLYITKASITDGTSQEQIQTGMWILYTNKEIPSRMDEMLLENLIQNGGILIT